MQQRVVDPQVVIDQLAQQIARQATQIAQLEAYVAQIEGKATVDVQPHE